jgi:hypothetical protein
VIELLAEIVLALLSGPVGAAEEWVAEHWAAVSQAMRQRLAELKIARTELERRSKVSHGTVGELLHNTKQRERNASILEALSVALGWKRGHLAAVRDGIAPPLPDEPDVVFDSDVPGRLRAVEDNVRKTNTLLAELVESMNKDRRLDEIAAEFETRVRRLFIEFRSPNEER